MPKLKIILVIFVLTLILFIGGFYYYHFQSKINYLIPGVPYYGIYNYFFSARSDTISSVADILGYWGDDRFDLAFLAAAFPPGNYYSTFDIQKFFQENGYETYRWASENPKLNDMLGQMKKFINPKSKIPLIVSQKLFANTDSPAVVNGKRVAIGIFDKDEKVIVHDHFFGNNYQISYDDFGRMSQQNFGAAILAIWPSEKLSPEIRGTDFSMVYSERSMYMEKLGPLFIKNADSIAFYRQGDYEKTIQFCQEAIDDPNLIYLPPIYRVHIFHFLAQVKFKVASTTPSALNEVIDFINTRILPLNNNLSKYYEGWPDQSEFFEKNNYIEDKFADPYFILGQAYFLKGNKVLAKKNFEEVLKIYPEHKPSQEALAKLK